MQECAETVYDLTELRGGSDELARTKQLCSMLLQQNQLLKKSVEQLQVNLGAYHQHVKEVGREVGVE